MGTSEELIMTRHLAIAVSLAALALPAIAQQHTYDYEDEAGSAWSNEAAPPGEGSYSEYPADDARSSVDVNVDMATPDASVTFDTFRDGLSPYGEWMNLPNYGHVWRPAHVAADWRPYYYGRWEWTDEGWLWVSDEPWGWAAYHYGRWAYDQYNGWVWVPGYQWAPAWVTWRYSPDYIGWAPLAPGFSVFVSSYPVGFAWWTFVPFHSFVAVPVFRVAVPFGHVRGIFHAAVPAPPRARVFGAVAPAWGGPARPFVEHRLGRPVTPVRLQAVPSASAAAVSARAGVVPIYRPEVRAAPVAGRAAIAAPPPSRPPAPSPAAGRAATAAPMRPWGGGTGAGARPTAPPQGGARPAQPRGGWRGAPPPAGTQRMMTPAPASPRVAPGARFPGGGQPQVQHGGGQVQQGGGAQRGGGQAQPGGGAQRGGSQAQHGGGAQHGAAHAGGGHR
jgi:hypothetical protein